MKKWFIILLTILVLLPLVNAGLCEDRVDIGASCTILTPYITCSDNYTIFWKNGTIALSGVLNPIATGFYNFSFQQAEGDYIIQLCDYSTRQIVVGDAPMVEWLILLLAFIFVGGCFYMGFTYEPIFIYAAATSAILFGLLLILDLLQDWFKYIIGMLILLLGIGFIYFERKSNNEKQDQDGLGGKWL